jgi:UDP-2,3-diacylglucosamine hydrolase
LKSLSNLHSIESALLFSDVHLNDETPALTGGLIDWLAATVIHSTNKPQALIVLGDLFDAWIGDDTLDHTHPNSAAHRMLATFSDIARQGVKIYFMHGNRDFLLGQGFIGQCHGTLLADPAVMQMASVSKSTSKSIPELGAKIVLTHGDLLCTQDTAYQAFRHQVRQPSWQTAFLGQSFQARLATAKQLKETTGAAKADKALEIMDVTVNDAVQLTDQLAADVLLHGHTHRPGCSPMPNGRDRWVLPDWEVNAVGELIRGGGLWVDAQGVRVVPAVPVLPA